MTGVQYGEGVLVIGIEAAERQFHMSFTEAEALMHGTTLGGILEDLESRSIVHPLLAARANNAGKALAREVL